MGVRRRLISVDLDTLSVNDREDLVDKKHGCLPTFYTLEELRDSLKNSEAGEATVQTHEPVAQPIPQLFRHPTESVYQKIPDASNNMENEPWCTSSESVPSSSE